MQVCPSQCIDAQLRSCREPRKLQRFPDQAARGAPAAVAARAMEPRVVQQHLRHGECVRHDGVVARVADEQARGRIGHRHAPHAHIARAGPEQTSRHPEQPRFTRPGRANDAGDLARQEGQ